jgi:hypothetical protein
MFLSAAVGGGFYIVTRYKPSLGSWLSIFLFATTTMPFLAGFAWNLFLAERDYFTLRLFNLNRQSVLNAQELISQYNRLRSGIWRVTLLRRVRSQNILLQNKDSERAVRQLLIDVEHEYASFKVELERARSLKKMVENLTNLTYRSFKRNWSTAYTRLFKGNIFPRLSEQRDELYILLENLTRERSIRSLGGSSDSVFVSKSMSNGVGSRSLLSPDV